MTAIWRDRVILFSPLAAIVALFLAPAAEEGPTICPIALCTGTACPGCGMTRAASRLLRGDLGAALTFHPLIPLMALLAVAGWTWFVLVRAGKVEPPDRGLVNGVLVMTAIALVAVWIARLVTGTLPAV
jgi:hypothetical protein